MHKLTPLRRTLISFSPRVLTKPFQYLVLSTVFFLGACSHFEHHHHGSEMMTSHHSNSADKTLNINLNGDNKWLMDAHTRSVASTMMNRFSSLDLELQNQQELEDLGEQLGQDLDTLIQGCTMEGEAHNALHDFLTSFMPALEEFKTTASVDSAKHVKHLLAEYQNYFE
jgi:hypothetical protein